MIAGCYTLDLYCDHHSGKHGWNEFPHQFTGELGSECRGEAKNSGWKINERFNLAVCPKCARGGVVISKLGMLVKK